MQYFTFLYIATFTNEDFDGKKLYFEKKKKKKGYCSLKKDPVSFHYQV